jgi:hypothetical protein
MTTQEHAADAGHTRRVTVVRSGVGWEIREERDSRIVRTTRHTDWHRVERALRLIEQGAYSTNR